MDRTPIVTALAQLSLEMPKLPVPTMSAEARLVLHRAGAEYLAPAIAAAECVATLDLKVLKCMGMRSSASSQLILVRMSGELLATLVTAIAGHLMDKDKTLRKLVDSDDKTERTAGSLLIITRDLAMLVDALFSASHDGGDDKTSYVVTQTEEERGMTMPRFNNDDVTKALTLLKSMYNMRVRKHQLSSLKDFKKVAYYTNEYTWPDPTKVTLEGQRRAPTDTNFLLFERICYTVINTGVGKANPPHLRDDKAGVWPKYDTQWAQPSRWKSCSRRLASTATP